MIALDEEKDAAVIEAWYAEAKKATPANFAEFVRKLMNDYEHDYGTICHAVAAAALAAAHAVDRSPSGGITGFQAQMIFWQFFRKWGAFSGDDEGPVGLRFYKQMIYPQCREKFEKTMPVETKDRIVELAKAELAKTDARNMDPEVRKHMQEVADGFLPWGYTVKKDED